MIVVDSTSPGKLSTCLRHWDTMGGWRPDAWYNVVFAPHRTAPVRARSTAAGHIISSSRTLSASRHLKCQAWPLAVPTVLPKLGAA